MSAYTSKSKPGPKPKVKSPDDFPQRAPNKVALVAIESKWLRPKQAAAIANVSIGTIYAWIDENKFPSWNVRERNKERGMRLISKEGFETFLNTLCLPGKEAPSL